MSDTEFQPTLPVEGAPSDAELDFMELSPPGLFPQNQNSNFGYLIRKLWADKITELTSQLTTMLNEKFPDTSTEFLDDHERQYGLPVAPTGLTVLQRQQNVLNRIRVGPFTRARRNAVIESFITATFGAAVAFSPAGIAFDSSGIPLYSGLTSLEGLYYVVEDIPGFSYTVQILDTIAVDMTGLTRELQRITPAHISFSIVTVPFISALTMTNVITDALRQSALAWPATQTSGHVDGPYITNNCTNGGFETGIAGWSTFGTKTISQSTEEARFGTHSMKCVDDAGATPDFASYTVSTAVNGITQTWSAYVYIPSDYDGGAISIDDELTFTGATKVTANATANMALRDQWQRLVLKITYAADVVGGLFIRRASAPTAGKFIYVDGVQVEDGSVANEYLDTNSGAATGIPQPHGIYIAEAMSNIALNSQANAITGYSVGDAGSSIAISSAVPGPFSPNGILYTSDGSAANQHMSMGSAAGQAAAPGAIASGSFYFKGTAGQQYFCELFWVNTDTTLTAGANVFFTATGRIQKIECANVAVASGKTGDNVIMLASISGTRADSFRVWNPMIKKLPPATNGLARATTYIPTGGVASSISAGTIYADSSLLSASQGWFAQRIRWGFDSALPPVTNSSQTIQFQLDDSSFNNRLVGYNSSITRQFEVASVIAGVAEGAVSASIPAFSKGDETWVVFMWTPTTLKVSVNGGAPVSIARTLGIPAGINEFSIGHARGVGQMYDELKLSACGSGIIDNATLAALYELLGKSNFPVPAIETIHTEYPAIAITALMPMVTSAYTYFPANFPS